MSDYFPNTGNPDPTTPEMREALRWEELSLLREPFTETDPHTGEITKVTNQPAIDGGDEHVRIDP